MLTQKNVARLQKDPHMGRISQPVRCDVDTKEKVEKTRGKWLWQRFRPATDFLFDSFQVQTPKDQRPNIPEKTISQSDHLKTQLWTEMDWVNDNGYWSFWGVLWTLTRLPRVNNCTLNWEPDLNLSFQQHFTSLCVSLQCYRQSRTGWFASISHISMEVNGECQNV